MVRVTIGSLARGVVAAGVLGLTLSASTESPRDRLGLVGTDLGCTRSTGAEDLTAFLTDIASTARFDNVHVYPLGGDRHLWLVNDAFVDHDADATNLRATTYVNNVALVQDGLCFELIHRGSRRHPQEFESGNLLPGDGVQFFWPLGGMLRADGSLVVVWSQMINDLPQRDPSDGIVRHPIATWYARYDPVTLARVEFRPMFNSGVFPQYGFSVESDEDWTYLYGNSNLLNFFYEGGFYGEDHSATRMYLARVPLGRVNTYPTYWDGRGWSDDPAAAAPISERFDLENQMQVRRIGDRWLAVTKEDGFLGRDIVVDAAPDPWGPWTEVGRYQVEPPPPTTGTPPAVAGRAVYHPYILPWGHDGDSIRVVLSGSGLNFTQVMEHPSLYQAFVVDLAVPVPPPIRALSEQSPDTVPEL